LLSAIPTPNPKRERARQRIILQGDVPSPSNPPAGCRFNPRCPLATDICREEEPPLRDLGAGGSPHLVACHHAE
jgi:oligopeptide/dipeptide ABC transporter ATP-binding protein